MWSRQSGIDLKLYFSYKNTQSFFFYFFFITASTTHTEKKQKLHRINKVIKRKKKVTNKVTKKNKQRIYTLTWQYTYKY